MKAAKNCYLLTWFFLILFRAGSKETKESKCASVIRSLDFFRTVKMSYLNSYPRDLVSH